MGHSRPRFAPYSVQVRNQLQYINIHNQKAFNKWHNEYIRDSKHSNQDNLPSSQLPSLKSIVVPRQKQLFVLIDTCSLVKHQAEFVDHVTNLRISFRGSQCPIRFIIPLVVVEELDKCNRRSSKKRIKQPKQSPQTRVDDGQNPPINDVLASRDPPRSFMRIIEEELRTFQIIVPDLDPERKFFLNESLSSSINDNRILDSCLRARRFIDTLPKHEETRVILVTEDNNFKTKATTFQVASFRWREFIMKYHNFGKKNCVETPLLPAKENTCCPKVNGHPISSFDVIKTPKLVTNNGCIKIEPLPQFTSSQELKCSKDQTDAKHLPYLTNYSTLGKLLPTRESRRQVNYGDSLEKRATSQKVKSVCSGHTAAIFETLLNCQGSQSSQDEVQILKELGNLCVKPLGSGEDFTY